MSDNEYPICGIETWKRFVHGRGEPPAGVKSPDEVVLIKTCSAEVGKLQGLDLSKREVPIVFSTESVDRDGDIVRQRGIDFGMFRKNPVVLFAHQSRELPIARSMKLFQTSGRTRSVSIDRFAPRDLNEMADSVFRMLTHETPFLNAASIGFRPTKFERREVDEDEAQGFFFPTEFIKSEKLEHSIVPVPANPEALIGAKSVGIDVAPIARWAEHLLDEKASFDSGPLTRKNLERCWDIARGETRSLVVPSVELVDDDGHDDKEEVVMVFKGVTPPNPSGFTAAPTDTPWRALRFSDFGEDGPFEDLPASRRRQIARHFAWAEMLPPANFGQLKLGHHRASDMAVVLRGVNAALAVLNGARGGVDIPDADRAPAARHLNNHRRNQFDLEPIELRSMEEAEMKELLERLAKEIAEAEGIEFEEAEKALSEAIDAYDGDDTDAKEYTEEQLRAIITDAVKSVHDASTDDSEPSGVDGKGETGDDTAMDDKATEHKELAELVAETVSRAVAEAIAKARESAEQKSDDDDDSDPFEFPSIKEESEASKDTIEQQVADLRTEQRHTVELLRKLVDTIKASGTADDTKEEDAVVLVVGDDGDSADKDGGAADNVGRFIAEQTAEAVTRALAKATGRLPN